MRRNGVTQPEKEGNVKRVWDICDANQAELAQDELTKDAHPLREVIMEKALQEGIPEGTSKSQYSNWCRFHGIDSRAVNKKLVEA